MPSASYRALHDVLLALHEARDRRELSTGLICTLPGLFKGQFYSVDELDFSNSSHELLADAGETDKMPDGWQVFIGTNPIIPLIQTHGLEGFCLSRDISSLALVRTDFFNLLYRPLGLRDQLGVLIRCGDRAVGLAINRDRPFQEDERDLMDLIGAHLKVALGRCLPLSNAEGFEGEAMARLTTREREVLGWIAAGKRDREIAIILGIAAGTARKHVENVLKKMAAENRTAAAAMYHEAKGKK